jgi:hypothetical protein
MAGGSDAEKRINRYKEERRRQLASQIANRLSAAGSSSDEDDSLAGAAGGHAGNANRLQHESYSRYRRRRRKEVTPSSSSDHVGSGSGGSAAARSARSGRDSARRRPVVADPGRQSPEHIYHQIDVTSTASRQPPPVPTPRSSLLTSKGGFALVTSGSEAFREIAFFGHAMSCAMKTLNFIHHFL